MHSIFNQPLKEPQLADCTQVAGPVGVLCPYANWFSSSWKKNLEIYL
jgi:hypothetical protein